jgi:uncharacterized protein
MKMLTPVIAALLLVASAASNAASFNCAEAKQPIEIAICTHPDVSQADDQLAAAYRALLGKLSSDGATKLKGVQRRFDKQVRSVCVQFDKDGLPACVLGRFRRQAALFKSLDVPELAVTLDGSFTPWSNDDEASISAIWPEIDQPSALAATINPEIDAVISGLIPKEAEARPYELTLAFNALSPSLISITFHSDHLPSQAAPHGTYARVAFNFLPGRLRKPTQGDFFKSDDAWQKLAADTCAKELQGTVFDFVMPEDAGSWRVSSAGIAFDCTADHPDNQDPISATLSWDSLRPFLKPDAPIPTH